MPAKQQGAKQSRRATAARLVVLPFLLLTLSLNGAGYAQAAAAIPLVPPVSVSSIVLVDTSGSTDTLIVNGELPPQTPLPARLELPIPPGVKPNWVGEIVGSDPSKDPTAEYTTRTGQGYDVVTVTLKQSRKGQVEIGVTAPSRAAAAPYTASLPILSEVGSASIAFDIPTGSQVTSISAGLAKAGTSGNVERYELTQASPRVGSVLSGSLVVARPANTGVPQTAPQPTPGGADAASTQSSGSPMSATDVFLWIMLVGAVVFFLYNAYRFSQVRAARIAAEADAHVATDSSTRHGKPGTTSPSVTAAGSGKAVKHADPASLDRELERLQNLRAQGGMSRQEFLKAKSELLGHTQH